MPGIRSILSKAAGALQRSSPTLPSVTFDDGGVEKVVLRLPPSRRPDQPSVTVFALPKSGSTLLDGIMRKLSRKVGLRYVSVMGEFFSIGIPPEQMPAGTSSIFLPNGYCYGGFRHLPPFDIPILSQSRPVLLVRDPRDMLVSFYFSMRESHQEPGNKLESTKVSMPRDPALTVSIDDYVTGSIAESFRSMLTSYRTKLCKSYDVKLYRYEDVIYDKADWVADLSTHFGWDVPRRVTDAIAKRNDKMPVQERTDQHVRQVHPGNYRKKLKLETISWLDEFFREEMEYFGYSPTP